MNCRTQNNSMNARHGPIVGPILIAFAGSAFALAGCTWNDGEPFATVTARLAAELEIPADRDLGQEFQKLTSNYEIAIDEFSIEPAPLDLIGVDLDQGTQGFDPANPPSGYSLCHNGHCHADDGSLVPYEDIAAALDGGSSDSTAVIQFTVTPFDIVGGTEQALPCTPSCDVPRINLVRAELPAARLIARGRIRDGRAEPRITGEKTWSLDITLATDSSGNDASTDSPDASLVWSSPLTLPVDRANAPNIEVLFTLTLSSRVFDDINWADVDSAGHLDQLAQNEPARIDVLSALGETVMNADVRRAQ